MAPYTTADHAAAIYYTVSGSSLALHLTIPPTTEESEDYHPDLVEVRREFRVLVHQVRDFYTNVRNSPENLALAPSFWSMATPHFPNATSK